MKIKASLTIICAIILVSCSPVVVTAPTNTTIPTTTFTPAPTLPSTLTPIPPLPTSTPLAIPTVVISKEDYDAIERAKQEVPSYRQGDLTIKLQDSNGKPLRGYDIQYQQISHQFQFMSTEDWPSNIRYLSPSGFNGLTLVLGWTTVEPQKGHFNLEFNNYFR